MKTASARCCFAGWDRMATPASLPPLWPPQIAPARRRALARVRAWPSESGRSNGCPLPVAVAAQGDPAKRILTQRGLTGQDLLK